MLDTARPFALIEKNGVITAYQGTLHHAEKLAAIEGIAKTHNTDVVFVLPYNVIRERGFEAQGDEPILVLTIEDSFTINRDNLPDEAIMLAGEIKPSIDDDRYAELIAEFQASAIEQGHCSQATISRLFSGCIQDFSIEKVLSIYKKLLEQPGHYMTILFANGDHFLVAGTPERHLELTGDHAIMTPIAGTFRKENGGSLIEFLNDPKEINELFQVVDEEMKMMGVICPTGGTIQGPYLHEVGAVIHTEYELVGTRTMKAMDALRHSLHAPTVVGSPLESAARQIAHYEPNSRRYYAGEIGIYKPETDELDCAILIRGAEISGDGTFHVQAGGGIVRDSDPASEAQESRAKANGILNVLTGKAKPHVMLDEMLVREMHYTLMQRNAQLSSFWRSEHAPNPLAALKDLSITIINNEDDFAFMIAHMLRFMGCGEITVVDTFAFDAAQDESRLIILGPGPGDPTDKNHPRMIYLQEIIAALKMAHRPMLGICLGHQVLAVSEGICVTRQPQSSQGMPKTVQMQGQSQTLAFYNSFSPVLNNHEHRGFDFDMDQDGRVIAMRGDNMIGYQFHPESVMSIDGTAVLIDALTHLGFLAPTVSRKGN